MPAHVTDTEGANPVAAHGGSDRAHRPVTLVALGAAEAAEITAERINAYGTDVMMDISDRPIIHSAMGGPPHVAPQISTAAANTAGCLFRVEVRGLRRPRERREEIGANEDAVKLQLHHDCDCLSVAVCVYGGGRALSIFFSGSTLGSH